jgi:hypothetical protein
MQEVDNFIAWAQQNFKKKLTKEEKLYLKENWYMFDETDKKLWYKGFQDNSFWWFNARFSR